MSKNKTKLMLGLPYYFWSAAFVILPLFMVVYYGITDKNGLNTWRAILREQFHLDLPEVEEKRQKNTYRKSYRDPEAEDPNEGLIP